ncbi:MAG: hypothetical protein AB8F34_07280 [Akkermansiaceae bacterium]
MKTNQININTFAASLFAAATLIGSANAAISVTNTSANVLEDTSNSATYTNTISSWSLNGGNAVVVYFSGENTLGVTAKYGTEDLTIVETTGSGNDHVAAIGYIIDPTASTADLDVTWAAQGNSENMITALSLGGVGSVVALSGAALGGPDKADSVTGRSIQIDDAMENSVIILSHASNDHNPNIRMSLDSSVEKLFSGPTGSSMGAAAYFKSDSSDPVTVNFPSVGEIPVTVSAIFSPNS